MNGGAVRGKVRHEGEQLGAQESKQHEARELVNTRTRSRKALDTDRATPRYPFRKSGR